MTDLNFICTPEDLFEVPADAPPGYPTDAIDCALTRAESTLIMLSGQFDGTGAEQNAPHIVSNVLWAVQGEIRLALKMLRHGHKTEGK
ncbi:hypothetical protein [Pseudomonas sp. TMP25]|uniref:hypothetical protein n=1 Tax=Pseudomonas sp. TMP25 TaxID=3136561 RepID=UPI003100C14F